MKRIIVIGSSGAGKSTLAEQIARELNLPYTELDSLFHLENWQEIDRDEFRTLVSERTKTDGWVFCGNYFSTLGMDFFKKSDTLIWLDYSFPLVLSRLVRRTMKRTTTRQTLWNGNRESFKNFIPTKNSVIGHMMRSWNKQQTRYNALFADHTSLPGVELIRLKTPAEAAQFLQRVHESS